MKTTTWKLGVASSTILVALLTLSGCVSSTATPATQGEAYITTNTIFTGNMYHCDAKGGAPACWRVVESGPVAK
jgi:hypothetical protein